MYSHDLKDTLGHFKGYVGKTLSTFKGIPFPNRISKEYLQITHDNIDKTLNLINQLFEYSKT